MSAGCRSEEGCDSSFSFARGPPYPLYLAALPLGADRGNDPLSLRLPQGLGSP
jgi:hypothetical protein